MMQDVDKIRATYQSTGAITRADVFWLLEKMEIGERLSKSVLAYKDIAEKYIDRLTADLASLELAKDIEIHELKERLKQYEPENVEIEAPEKP